MSYEYYYNNARNRYYNACSEINSCQNKLNDLRIQQQNTVNRINQLKTDIKDHENAYEQMVQVVWHEDGLNSKLAAVMNKTDDASANFIGMAVSSNVVSKNLTQVYGDETARTKSTLSDVMSTLNTRKNTLNAKISDLNSQLRAAENQLQNIKSQISSTQADLAEWRRIKTNASYDMEYYRRKMQEAV